MFHGGQVSAVDRTRDACDADTTDVLEQLARNARHVLVVNEQDEIVDEPVTGGFVARYVVRCFVVGLLAQLLRLEAAVLLQKGR